MFLSKHRYRRFQAPYAISVARTGRAELGENLSPLKKYKNKNMKAKRSTLLNNSRLFMKYAVVSCGMGAMGAHAQGIIRIDQDAFTPQAGLPTGRWIRGTDR